MTNAMESQSAPVAVSLKNLGCFVCLQNVTLFLQWVSLNCVGHFRSLKKNSKSEKSKILRGKIEFLEKVSELSFLPAVEDEYWIYQDSL